MAAETMRARQAALLLHSLPPYLRRRVIARLNTSESSTLQPLLVELAGLGVSQSLGLQLQHLAISSVPKPGTDALAEQVESLNAADVVARLSPCAAATVAQLLRAGGWSWKARVLELMPDGRRAEVLACMRSDSCPLAPAALRTLCERLCKDAVAVPVHGSDHTESRSIPSFADDSLVKRRRTIRTRVRAGIRRWMRWMR